MPIVDTSVLLAAGNARDSQHHRCAELLENEARLVIPAPVVTETSIMLNRRLGATHEARFLTAVASGCFRIADLDATDYRRTVELMEDYNGPSPYLGVIVNEKTNMTNSRREYTAEFRSGAVQMVRETRQPIARVVRDLGLVLGSWAPSVLFR